MTELIEKTVINRFEDADADLRAAITPVFADWLERWKLQGITPLEVENLLELFVGDLSK
jgi:hypothetical protein